MTATATSSNQAELLLSAFNSFNEVSNALESAYGELHLRVQSLSQQLEQSNYYLTTVLQNLPCGVLVVDPERMVTTVNEEARTLFEIGDRRLPFPVTAILENAEFSERAASLSADGDAATEITFNGRQQRTLHCSWSRLRGGERILVVQDVTRVKLLEKRMRETERLAAMGEMAMEVAHEIRNPLGALELFASLLAEDDLEAGDRLLYSNNVRIGIRSLNTVLNNLLCVRRTPNPALISVSLAAVLGECAEFMKPLLEQRGIRVVEDLQTTSPVQLDDQMIRQIITNLLTNAMQALPEGGEISLRSRESEGDVTIEVEDTGVGIPEKYQRLIFDSGFTMSKGGSGLGLAIVRRLLDALGGRIEVHSREGQGSRFILSFSKETGCE